MPRHRCLMAAKKKISAQSGDDAQLISDFINSQDSDHREDANALKAILDISNEEHQLTLDFMIREYRHNLVLSAQTALRAEEIRAYLAERGVEV